MQRGGEKENFAPPPFLPPVCERLRFEIVSMAERDQNPLPPPPCRELNFYSCANDAAIFRSLNWALKLSGQFRREDVLLFSNRRKGLLRLHPSFVSVLMNPFPPVSLRRNVLPPTVRAPLLPNNFNVAE